MWPLNSFVEYVWCENNTTGASEGRGGGSRGSNEPPLEVSNGGLKTQTVDFQILANSGGMGYKL